MSVTQQLNWAVGEPASQRALKLLAVRYGLLFFPEKASKTDKKLSAMECFFFLQASKEK